jgi:hypothetical protein
LTIEKKNGLSQLGVQSRCFLVPQILTKKYDEAHNNFLKILCYIVVWGTMPFSLVRIFGSKVDFMAMFTCSSLVEKNMFPTMVTKTMELHVLQHFIETNMSLNFDLV